MLKHFTQLKAYLFGIGIATFGVLIYIVSDAYMLEEHFGLDTLFQLRGIEKPPIEVAVIALEKSSSDYLNVPNTPTDWPRDVHAKLIEKLSNAGVASITFDLFFKRQQSPDIDNTLAEAISKSGNVLLVSHIQREIQTTDQVDGTIEPSGFNIEKIIPPLASFTDNAVAVAPFVLPKYPVKVTKFWTYRVSAGDIPNLPAVTLQLYCQDAYAWLRQQLLKRNTVKLPTLPTLLVERSLVATMIQIRSLFNNDSQLLAHLLGQVNNDKQLSSTLSQKINALLALYSGPHRYYANFYGPPWTINTIPYHQVLSASSAELDLKGKAIFVGFSERLQPEQQDNFNTVYSQINGLDLSGVEIAATAFANLLHQKTITPLQPLTFISLVFLYGFIVAFLSRSFKPVSAVSISLLIAATYLLTSAYLFEHRTIWLPWVVPVLFLTPLTLFIALGWHYFDAYRDRKHIRAAFGMYLPDHVINEISKQRDPMLPNPKVMHGIVLATDAAEYTNLAETMSAGELGELMNSYYELLFRPIKQNNGIVCDVVGDAMMALWSSPEVNPSLRQKACNAAIDINQNLGLSRNKTFALPTRIGLHAGEIALGNVGAFDHYEYRVIGDIVNTASRIESFNKQLGTRCLASSEVVKGTTGLLHRDLGTFTLAGKRKPITLYEIISTDKQAKDSDHQLCDQFATGITAYRQGNIEDANGIFTTLKHSFPNDGPTRFYVELCQRVDAESATSQWNSVISINIK